MVKIGNREINLLPNSSFASKNPLTSFLDWSSNKQSAIFRLPRVWATFLNLINASKVACGQAPNEAMRSMARTSMIVSNNTLWFRLVPLWNDAREAIAELKTGAKAIPGAAFRQAEKAIQTVAEFSFASVMSASVVVSIIPGTDALCARMRAFANCADWTSNLANAAMSSENFVKTTKALSEAPDGSDIKNHLKETQKRDALSLAKEICGVAGAVFGFFTLVTGAALVSEVAALSIGLAGGLFAIGLAVQEGTMKHKPVAWFNPKHVAMVNA